MTAARIALATAAEFPDLDDDGPVLLAALAARGLTAEPAVWTDPDVDWPAYDLVVVRCTWDYHERRADFLDWARRVAAVTTLANSADVLAWNTDKTYLRTLREAGLPVVPTDWLEPGDVFVGARGRRVRREAGRVRGRAGHQPVPGRGPRRRGPSRTRATCSAPVAP